MKTTKPKRMFEFSFPDFFPPKPPFVQIFYENEPLSPVQFEMAERYSRFMRENISQAAASMPDLFVLVLTSDPLLNIKTVQAVIESLVNGRIKIPMDERWAVLRASRLLKVDLLQKAIEEHLTKGCRSRPDLRLQCLEAVFDASEDDEFRQRRFEDARKHFYDVVNSKSWVKLNVDIVRELLSDDEQLKVKERDVFVSVLKWSVSNPLQIPAHIDRLLSLIRFGSMSTEEKMACMDEARRVGLDSFVKPHLIEGDWYRTCHELNHAEFTDLVEFDRLSHFIGENRRGRALDAHVPEPRWQKSKPGIAVTIETTPTALERAQDGKIEGGTWMRRPRSASVDVSGSTSASSRSMKYRMSTVGVAGSPGRTHNQWTKKRLLGKKLATEQ